MPLIRIAAAAALLVCSGCAGGSAFRDEFRASDRDLALDVKLRLSIKAPLIVLGSVTDVNLIGQPTPSGSDRRIGVQLTRIKIKVEEAIKGDVPGGILELYYFVYAPQASEMDLGVPRYIPTVGQRRIYFLKRDNGRYRSVGDVLDYTVRVSSGKHPEDFCSNETPGCCIAELLLIPQEGIDPGWFVVDMVSAQYIAEVLCSHRKSQELLRNLVHHTDPRIAERAREVIASTLTSHAGK